MTRILVQRGSSSNSNRLSQQPTAPQTSQQPNESDQSSEICKEPSALDDPLQEFGGSRGNALSDDENLPGSHPDVGIAVGVDTENFKHGIDEIRDTSTVVDGSVEDPESSPSSSSQVVIGVRSYPPPPPVPPPKPTANIPSRRKTISGILNADSRRASAWPVVSTRTSPSNSKPTSPKSVREAEGYNSADEQNTCFVSSYGDLVNTPPVCSGDLEREHLFEIEIKRVKGLEVKRMVEDGNCLFRAVADQIYGDAESYDMARQLCIDYMERERDHFSQFITEGFVSYCKRKRRDKVYGNNVEIQVFSEMYNRPIHIYSYSTEPINIFHGTYRTDTPPLRLSYHHGNHYNSLVDPRRLSIGAGLGLSSLQGANIGKDQVKAAIKAQQDQQIDNALLAEGRFYSDLEYTETEIEQMVIEASRFEFLEEQKIKQQQQQLDPSESSTSISEPSSSGKGTGVERSISNSESRNNTMIIPNALQNESFQVMLSMGFSYLQASEAYDIFGDDVDSMICYLLDIRDNSKSGKKNSRQKGKAAE